MRYPNPHLPQAICFGLAMRCQPAADTTGLIMCCLRYTDALLAGLTRLCAECRPGLRADFTLYSDSILESGEHMPHVLHTYLDGDLVWSSDESI